jgi:DNA-directed RNA polymerase specialized sigma24 family protein
MGLVQAAQESLARALVNIRKLKTPEKFAPWLTQICRYVAADMRRTRRRAAVVGDSRQARDGADCDLAVTTFDPRGPFAGAIEHMNKPDLECVGRRTTPNGEVNLFRRAFKRQSDNENWSYDFQVDAKTKRLVAIQVPGADLYDPETDPARHNPAEPA